MPNLARFTPESVQGYQRTWLSRDVIAGVTLAAVAIPETMGYTSIAQTPVVTGLYTVIFPTLLFALLGSSRLLVVGADSATAAILAAGLAGVGIAGLQPNTAEWVAWTSLVALVCGGLLVLARLLKLGFLGDFLSSSVLVGFLTGVGIQVFAGQIPDMLGIPKGSGNWFEQQWSTITQLGDANAWTVAFAAGALFIIVGFKRFVPKVPGAVVAVILSIVLSATLDASSHGVAIVGSVQGGFPPIGLPDGITWSDIPKVLGIAFSCFVLIIAQSAATSRSFAMKHNQRVDVNRDIVGLSGASFAAGLTGTFVVNGSPTKTQILDEQKGRTQVANMTMSLVVLIVVLFLTGLLTDMPKAVLAAIVFLIGIGLIDIKGLRRILAARPSEFVIAAITGLLVIVVGVEQAIIVAIVVSVIDHLSRSYAPKDSVVVGAGEGHYRTLPVATGGQLTPGLVVYRFSSGLYYANANRFNEEILGLVDGADEASPVRCVVLDAAAMVDVDYSGGLTLKQVVNELHDRGATLTVTQAEDSVRAELDRFGITEMIGADAYFDTVGDAVRAHEAKGTASAGPAPDPAEG